MSITFTDILAAYERIRGRILETPLIEVSGALARAGIPGRWWVKVESLQRGGSFKIRGVCARVSAWLEEGRVPTGLVTYSSGNHGIALSLVARDFGLPAVVAVPETIPGAKLDAIRAAGAEVLLAGRYSNQRREAASRACIEHGYTLVEPFDDEEVIAGQGSIAIEILERCPTLTDVVVPVGGGTLISGMSLALAGLRDGVRIHAVEPLGCDSFGRSLHAGEQVSIVPGPSLADGLRPIAPGVMAVECCLTRVRSAVLVDDEQILRAMRLYQHPLHLVAEPSGAASLAALLAGRIPSDEETRGVLVLSGGNADWGALAHLLWFQESATEEVPRSPQWVRSASSAS